MASDHDEEDMILEWVMDGSYSSEANQRVRWTDDGEMVIQDLDEVARTIQRFTRKMLGRSSIRECFSEPEPEQNVLIMKPSVHGLKRGGKMNPVGSFLVSKKTDKILSAGFIFQKGGEHRWAVGKKSGSYCPYHLKVDQGSYNLCICQCSHLPPNIIFT